MPRGAQPFEFRLSSPVTLRPIADVRASAPPGHYLTQLLLQSSAELVAVSPSSQPPKGAESRAQGLTNGKSTSLKGRKLLANKSRS